MDAKRRYQLERRRERKNRVRAMNSLDSPAGAGGCGDRGRDSRPARTRNHNALNRELVRWYYGNWSARKGIDIPVQDMLREPWSYTGLDAQQVKKIETAQDKMRLVRVLGQALRLERLLGGSVILMGVAEQREAHEPLDVSTVDKGCLKFLNVIPRNRITQTGFSNDPLSENFGCPEIYTVQGTRIHRSRLLIFDGDPIAPNNIADVSTGEVRRRNDGFGDSVMESVLDDLTYATGARQAAYQLINQASVWLLETDVAMLQETKGGDRRVRELERMSEQISLYRAAIMDNGGESRATSSLSSISPSFGSVPELMMAFLQVLSGAFDIPAMRYMSQAPGGLNATGDAPLENYYNRIGANQRQNLRPQLIKLLEVLVPSTLGKGVVDLVDVDVEFEPLWNLSETELSDIRSKDAAGLSSLVAAGVITTTEAEAEARKRKMLIAEETGELSPFEEDTAPNLDAALAELTGGI